MAKRLSKHQIPNSKHQKNLTSLRRSGIANLSYAFLHRVGDPATRLRAEVATAAQARRRESQTPKLFEILNLEFFWDLVLGI